MQNSLFLHYKTSMGDKSNSIEDKAVKFACSIAFSDMGDRHLCHMTMCN